MLVQHENASIDGYQEGVRVEYLIMQNALAGIVKDPRKFNEVEDKSDAFIRLLEKELKIKPAVITEVNGRVDEFYRDALAFRRPFSQWSDQLVDPTRIGDGSCYSKVALCLIPAGASLARYEAEAKLSLHTTECLIALRLWRIRSREAATDLEKVTRAAGLPGVPIDPYSGQPLRMAIIDGEPVIYSVGKDGRDDGGRIDSDLDRKPGDRTFRLPAVKKHEQP